MPNAASVATAALPKCLAMRDLGGRHSILMWRVSARSAALRHIVQGRPFQATRPRRCSATQAQQHPSSVPAKLWQKRCGNQVPHLFCHETRGRASGEPEVGLIDACHADVNEADRDRVAADRDQRALPPLADRWTLAANVAAVMPSEVMSSRSRLLPHRHGGEVGDGILAEARQELEHVVARVAGQRGRSRSRRSACRCRRHPRCVGQHVAGAAPDRSPLAFARRNSISEPAVRE